MKRFRLILIVSFLAIESTSYAQALSAEPELEAGLRAAELYRWTDARPHFQRAQQLSRPSTRIGVLARIGLLRATMEQRNLAELTRTFAAMDRHPVVRRHADVRMWLYIAKGDCDNDLQFPEVARRDWQIVKELATTTRNPKWSYRADGELSIPAYYLGDLATSRKLVGQALSEADDAKDAASVIRLLTHIGSVYILRGQVGPGMEHLRKAEAMAVTAPETGYPVVVKEMQILGLTADGKLAEAEGLAGQIIARTKALDRRIHEAQTRLMLAAIYEKQNRAPAAIRELEVVIQMARAGSFYHQLSQAQIRLSNLYRQAGDLQRAAQYAAQALQSTHNSGIVSALPTHMQFLAGLRASQGRYAEADLLYRKAEDEVDAQLALTPSGAKHLLLKSTSDIYTEHFALVAEHMRSVAAAYRIVERVRGRILADLLRSGSLAKAGGNPNAEREISALRLQLARATSPAEIARTRDAIFFARHKRWLADEPKATAIVRRQAGRVLPLTTVQRHLDSSDVLVEYVLTSSKAYALVITKAKVRLADLGDRITIDAAAGRFIAAVRAKQQAIGEGDALARLVLGAIPEVRSHSNLIVVPDAQLYSVPFAGLVLDGKRLIETHTVVRTPSASTYVMLRQKASVVGGGLLAVGGVRYNADASRIAQQRGYKLDNLPGSRDEAVAASDVLAPFMPDRLLLEGSQATETAVKQALKTPRTLIHLAVHGIASDRPDRGALVFLPDASATEDGLLEVSEIVQLRLSSDLAVLSACDTAVGQVQGQEGVANLSRAFLLGGSRSVVSTLWAIDDAFSATLMRAFYSSLVKGKSKSAALVAAQRYIVQRFPATAVPWYWAGYTLDGDGGTPLLIEGQRSRSAPQQ